jgi:hypothetical protein
MTCPKCGYETGNDWTQCEQCCPLLISPHYDALTERAFEPIDNLQNMVEAHL